MGAFRGATYTKRAYSTPYKGAPSHRPPPHRDELAASSLPASPPPRRSPPRCRPRCRRHGGSGIGPPPLLLRDVPGRRVGALPRARALPGGGRRLVRCGGGAPVLRGHGVRRAAQPPGLLRGRRGEDGPGRPAAAQLVRRELGRRGRSVPRVVSRRCRALPRELLLVSPSRRSLAPSAVDCVLCRETEKMISVEINRFAEHRNCAHVAS